MKLKNVKVGMKVVPHSKTVEGYCTFDECNYYRDAKRRHQLFMYVTGIRNIDGKKVATLSDLYDVDGKGSFYNIEDFEPYQECFSEILKMKEEEIETLEKDLHIKRKELEELKKNNPCEHLKVKVYSYFNLRFQCVDCGQIINRFDNHRTFTIVPNEEMEDPPPKTGLVEYSEVEKYHDGF